MFWCVVVGGGCGTHFPAAYERGGQVPRVREEETEREGLREEGRKE